MREIKFRYWDERNEVMHYNKQHLTSGNKDNDWICLVDLKEKDWDKNLSKNVYFAQQIKVMQYTGLKDKNGKEIYESNILKVYYPDRAENHVVNWGSWCDGEYLENCECWMVDGIPLSDINNKTYGHSNAEVEVIGNIYENSELIES